MRNAGLRYSELNLLYTDTHRPNALVTLRNVPCKTSFAQVGIEYTCGQLCTYVQGSQVGIPGSSNTLETVRPQHDRPFACVIAQQYSSATVISLRFLSREENCVALFKTTLFHFFTFFLNCVAVKLPTWILPKSGSVCVKISSISIMLSYWEAASTSKEC